MALRALTCWATISTQRLATMAPGQSADVALFPLAASERRAIVAENWGDFQRELKAAAGAGTTHYG